MNVWYAVVRGKLQDKKHNLYYRKEIYMSVYSDKIKNEYKGNPLKAIDQLEWCNYENEAGCLMNNIAWIALKELIKEQVDYHYDLGNYYIGLANQVED